MKLNEIKFKIYCPDEWDEELINRKLEHLKSVIDKLDESLRVQLELVSPEMWVETDS